MLVAGGYIWTGTRRKRWPAMAEPTGRRP